MFILWLYQNLFWPNLVWHLTCHIIVKILESCLITVCVLWSWFLFAIVLCVCARPRVCEGERVWVFFVCLFCMPCVEWVWMFLVLLFYVIYSRTIASIANVFCWLYPTLNKVYLILFYLILSYLILSFILSYLILVMPSFDVFFDVRLNKRLSKQWRSWWFETPRRPLWRRCNGASTYSHWLVSTIKCRQSSCSHWFRNTSMCGHQVRVIGLEHIHAWASS